MPQQAEMNNILGVLSRQKQIKSIQFIPLKNSQCNIKELEKNAMAQLQTIKTNMREEIKQIPGFWASQAEVKTKLKLQQELHEHRVLIYLSRRKEKQSLSCCIFLHLELNRTLMRTILRHLADSRALQTTLGNLICATRFKTLDKNRLVMTQCPKCGQANSWSHHIQCYNISLPQQTGDRQWPIKMRAYLEAIMTDKPAMPVATDREFLATRFESQI